MNSRNVTYSTVGDYQLPNLILNQPRKPLGKYGRLRRTYLKDHRPVLYNTMLLNGSLYPHLMEVEQTAESRMRQSMEQLLKQNPAPDHQENAEVPALAPDVHLHAGYRMPYGPFLLYSPHMESNPVRARS